jgi:hypothetical protein
VLDLRFERASWVHRKRVIYVWSIKTTS